MKKYIYDIDITGKSEKDFNAGNDMKWINTDTRDTKIEAIKEAKRELVYSIGVKGIRVVKCWVGDDEDEPMSLVEDVFIEFKN